VKTCHPWRRSHRLVSVYAFYRATLCVSAVFAVARCLSVRPSDTLMHCIHTAKDIVKLLSRPANPIVLVFWLPAPVPNSKGGIQRGAKYTRMEKICDFRPKSSFIPETVRDRPVVAMLIRNHQWRIDWCRFWSPRVTHNPGFKVTVCLQIEYLKNKISLS